MKRAEIKFKFEFFEMVNFLSLVNHQGRLFVSQPTPGIDFLNDFFRARRATLSDRLYQQETPDIST